MPLSSITPSQIKVSLFFAALLWLFATVDGNFYVMILLPWAAFMFVTSWKRANPGVAIFEERPAEAPKAAPTAKEAPVAEDPAAPVSPEQA